MTLGEKLLLLRKARQWSQEELAEQVGVTRQAVSRWEAGSAKPDADKLVSLCQTFGVTADYLLMEEEAPGGTVSPDTPARTWQRHAISGAQLLGALSVLAGVGIFLVLVALSVAHPHIHFFNGRKFTGLAGFLLGNDLVWLMIVSGCAVFSGTAALLWPRILSRRMKKKSAM